MGPSTSAPAPRLEHVLRPGLGRRRAVLPAVAVLALALAGCGGQSAEQEHGEAGGTTTQHAATATVPTQTSKAGLVDRAFVAQMIPHHEMAVAMAREAPERAEHAPLRRLARSIAADQEREIDQLRVAAKRLGVQPAAGPGDDHAAHGDDASAQAAGNDHAGHGNDASAEAAGDGHAGHGAAAPGGRAAMEADAKTLGLTMDEMGMSMDGPDLATAQPFDRAFIDAMVPHHQGAIRMARAELARGEDPELKRLATAIVTAQEREIRRMNAWRASWYGAASPAGGVPPA